MSRFGTNLPGTAAAKEHQNLENQNSYGIFYDHVCGIIWPQDVHFYAVRSCLCVGQREPACAEQVQMARKRSKITDNGAKPRGPVPLVMQAIRECNGLALAELICGPALPVYGPLWFLPETEN